MPDDCAGWVHTFVSVAETYPACIVISDMSIPGNPMFFVNQEFCKVTGYAKEDVQGRNCRFLQGPQTEPQSVRCSAHQPAAPSAALRTIPLPRPPHHGPRTHAFSQTHTLTRTHIPTSLPTNPPHAQTHTRTCGPLVCAFVFPNQVAVIQDTLRRGVDCHVKLTNYRKNGDLFENLLTMRPVHDSNGVYRFCIGVQFEITEDTALTSRLSKLNKLVSLLPATLEVGSQGV